MGWRRMGMAERVEVRAQLGKVPTGGFGASARLGCTCLYSCIQKYAVLHYHPILKDKHMVQQQVSCLKSMESVVSPSESATRIDASLGQIKYLDQNLSWDTVYKRSCISRETENGFLVHQIVALRLFVSSVDSVDVFKFILSEHRLCQ
jgi:hypothetical protein